MSPKLKAGFQVIRKDTSGTENSLGKGTETGLLCGASVERPVWAACWRTRLLTAAAGPNPGRGGQHPVLGGLGCQIRTLDLGQEQEAFTSQGSSQV